ncbi:MAG: hypothetical protein GX621_16565 [Pirellulaceae bacterium]|nr:hypothetical protein [Pirellulaceae bacterium]
MTIDQKHEAVNFARDVLQATWPDTPADRETRELVMGAAVIVTAEDAIRPDWLTVAARVTRQRATRNPRRFLLSTLANRLAESERYCPADQAPAVLDALLRRAQPIVDRVYRRPPPAKTPTTEPEP